MRATKGSIPKHAIDVISAFGPGDRGPSGGGRDLRLIARETNRRVVIPPPPTADTKTSAWEPDASTAHARGGRARGVVAFLTTVLVAIGFLFGAGTAAIASVTTTASVAEEAGVGEETVASRRGDLTRHRRSRSRTQRSEQPTGRWARRRLPSVPARSFRPAARRGRGPPLLAD